MSRMRAVPQDAFGHFFIFLFFFEAADDFVAVGGDPVERFPVKPHTPAGGQYAL